MLDKYRKTINVPFLDTMKSGGKIGLLYGSGFFILDLVIGISIYILIIIVKND